MKDREYREQKKLPFRHEYKYLCNAVENAVLKARAGGVLKQDSYCGEAGCYQIRSLYFDDFYDTCYYENESGINKRSKYRIRIYNVDKSRIVLEKKSKENGMTLKESAVMNEQICRRLMQGQYPDGNEITDRHLKLLLSEMQQKSMRPAVIVDYIL